MTAGRSSRDRPRVRVASLSIVALLACSPEVAPTPGPRPDAPTPPRGAPQAAQSAPQEPRDASPTPAPTPADAPENPVQQDLKDEPPPTSWHCLCYQRRASPAPEDVIGCRASAPECAALERRAQAGSRTIVADSVSRRCRSVGEATHPGALLGEPDAWQASSRPGAFFRVAPCSLPMMEGTGSEDPVDGAPDEWAVLRSETIAGINHGLPEARVRALLGEPDEDGKIARDEVDGAWIRTLRYRERGVSVTLAAWERRGPWGARMVIAGPPAAGHEPARSRRGLGIGDRRADVVARYKDLAAPEDEQYEGSYVLGSVYGGLIFYFEDDVVTGMLLGAAAE